MTTTTWAPDGNVRGLTDEPRLPRLGKIHLGVKKVSSRGNEYPSAVDYFVAPAVVQAVYGPTPRELDVVFPTDDVGRVAGVSWKQYSSARGKVCWGDGERAVRLVDLDKLPKDHEPHEQGEYDAAIVRPDSKNVCRIEIPCPAKDCAFAKKNACKPVMNLMFLLPKVPGIGVWQLDTGSVNSILDVRGGIELVMKLSGGRLAGIPLKLRIEPMEVINPDDQRKKVVFTLKLISPATLGRVLSSGDRNLRELLMEDDREARVALPEPREVPPPAEPEEYLYPREQLPPTDPTPQSTEPSATGSTQRTTRPPAPSGMSGDRAPIEVGSPSAAAPTADEFAIAAEIERLFGDLEVPAREREMYRKAYASKPKQLRDMLKTTLEKKQGGKK